MALLPFSSPPIQKTAVTPGSYTLSSITVNKFGQVTAATNGSAGSGTVTSVSVATANGISGTVATATTTPAITLALGAITPSTVNAITLSGSSTPTLAVTGTSSISGSNTGDQTITLTGDVTGTGTGSFATTIKSGVTLSGSPITTTQSPADNSTKIATTAYVDNAVLGQDFKQAVNVATTAVLATYVYNNGSSGVGATITAVATGIISFDGTALTAGMRVLVKNETSTNTPNNGIYTVTIAGAVGVALVLTRATDFDQSTDIDAGDSVFVISGTTQSTTTWAYNGITAPTIGTTNITFAQTAGQGSFTAGNGISITGNSIAINTAVTASTASNLSFFASTTSAQLAGIISDETGSGALVFASSPTLVTPALGTPASGVATNLTGTASGLTAGTVTTNANLTGPITSSGNATSIASQTGTGTKFVVDTSPTLITPILGAATATSINKVTITAPVTSATLTLVTGSSLITTGAFATTLAASASTTVTLPGTSSTMARTDSAQTFTGVQTFSSAPVFSSITNTGTLTLPTSSDTLVGRNTTDTLTNKSISGGQITSAVANATAAAGLTSATTTVVVSSATAPSSGQALIATSSTAATWQTIASIAWSAITTSQTGAINNGYITNSGSLVTITLPSTAAVGSIIEVCGLGAGGWKVAQAASVTIKFGSTVTTSGTGGSLASVNTNDTVRLIVTTANTGWTVLSSVGNLTVT